MRALSVPFLQVKSKFTLKELEAYDGRKGRPAYICYRDTIYDVTESFHWKNGNHWIVHQAGCDLTEAMDKAPHYDDVLAKFKVVGRLLPE